MPDWRRLSAAGTPQRWPSDMRSICLLGTCAALCSAPAVADPLDLYLGTGLGYATVQHSFAAVDVVQHPLGWKVFLGWRPVQMLAAELDYANLGSRDVVAGYTAQQATANAAAAFAVGYLPQALPNLDFYGKLGVSRLHSSISNAAICPPYASCPVGYGVPVVAAGTATRLAYGAGMQFGLGAELVRLEYLAFSTPGGDQSLLSLDVSFSF